MDEKQFETYLSRYINDIQALARKLAKRDQELFEDLVQEGRIALWGFNLARVRDNEDAWIRQSLYNKMVSFLRRERRHVFDSLDWLLERGAQVVVDTGGEAHIVSPVVNRPRRISDWEGPDDEA